MNKTMQIPSVQIITPEKSIQYYQNPTQNPIDTLPHKKYNQYSNHLISSKVINREYSPSRSRINPPSIPKNKVKSPSNYAKSQAKSNKPNQSIIGNKQNDDESDSQSEEEDFDQKRYEEEMKVKLLALNPNNFQISPLAESIKQERLQMSVAQKYYQQQSTILSQNKPEMQNTQVPLLPQQSEQQLYRTSQNFALFFHGFWKVFSILSYTYLPYVTTNLGTAYLSIVLFASLDFWTVKNITGRSELYLFIVFIRFLIGFRWFSIYNESKEYAFECRLSKSMFNSISKQYFFWIFQIIFILFWALASVYQIIRFRVTLVICFIFAIIEASTNIYMFAKAKMNSKKKIRKYLQALSSIDQAMAHSKNTAWFVLNA